MSKGSTPRPFDVDEETFAGNWTRIFNAKQKQESPDTSGEGTHPENQGDELHNLRPGESQ